MKNTRTGGLTAVVAAGAAALVAGCATPPPEKVPAGWNAASKICMQLRQTVGAGNTGPGPYQVYVDCMRRKGFEV
ncbi:MAG: hypothetical protein MUF30_02350 [Burkholderiales bacterium]|jgi:hypothetical protein|nr:hypothetical protein [Burkholderiales bacterium]